MLNRLVTHPRYYERDYIIRGHADGKPMEVVVRGWSSQHAIQKAVEAHPGLVVTFVSTTKGMNHG